MVPFFRQETQTPKLPSPLIHQSFCFIGFTIFHKFSKFTFEWYFSNDQRTAIVNFRPDSVNLFIILFSAACNSKNTRIKKSRRRQINCDKLCQRNSFCVSCFASRCIKTICHIRHTVRDFVTTIETLSTDKKITWGYHGKQNLIISQQFLLKVTEMATQSKCRIWYSLTTRHNLTRNGSS